MSRVQRLKAFFNKETYDYSKGPVNPYEFHKTFYYMCKFFRVIDDEPVPKWTLPATISLYICGILASIVCLMCLTQYIAIFDVPLITEAGTYFIIMVYKVLIIQCCFDGKVHYKNFLQAMRDDFVYICTKGSKYRTKFFENHLWTWKATISSSVFICIIAGGMSMCGHLALIYCLVFPTEGGVRPLPFPFWLFGLDLGKSPTYECSYVFCNLCILSHTITYIFMMQTQIVWIRQIMSKADVIIWSIQDLLVDIVPTTKEKQREFYKKVIEARMREIIKMHHSMYNLLEDYAGVYTKILMYEQKMCGPVMCLTAYGAAEKLETGEIPGILVLLCTAALILNSIPSYMNTALSEKVQSVGYACYDAPFWNAPGKAILPCFILIMQMAQRPLAIQAPGFDEVSLETFSDKVKFAYTGFNMLRQVKYK